MSEVEAWCVKDEDGELVPHSIDEVEMMVKRKVMFFNQNAGKELHKVVKVKISEVESD
jgi:hypothetical protein